MARTWPQIHRIAAVEAGRAHADLGIDITYTIDPFGALRDSNVLVMRQPLDQLSGAYLPVNNESTGGMAGVLINSGHPLSRQRFTAAHELWHHRRDQEITFDESTEILTRNGNHLPERERLADAFASWFLMPRQLVTTVMDKIGVSAHRIDGPKAYALSLELGTSYSATVHHLRTLHLIAEVQERHLSRISPQSIKQESGVMDVASDAWHDVRVVKPDAQSRSVTMTSGDVLVLDLEEIPSSGYRWSPLETISLPVLIRDSYQPRNAQLVGSDGIHKFVFSIPAEGQYQVRMRLGRAWKLEDIGEVREVVVSAESKPTPGIVDPQVLFKMAA